MSTDLLKSFVGHWELQSARAGAPIAQSCEERTSLEGFQRLLAGRPITLTLELKQGNVGLYVGGALTLPSGANVAVYASHSSPEPEIDGFFGDSEVYFYATRDQGHLRIRIDGTPPDHSGDPVIVHECVFGPPTTREARRPASTTASPPRRTSSTPRQVHDMAPDLYRQCGACAGSGRTTCSACGGTGGRSESRVDYDWEGNPTYNSEWISCSCAGGQVVCGTCGGSGSTSK